jgi:hypothetical protein
LSSLPVSVVNMACTFLLESPYSIPHFGVIHAGILLSTAAQLYSTKMVVHSGQTSLLYVHVCKGWAIKLAPAPRPSMIYCATPTASPLLILHFE